MGKKYKICLLYSGGLDSYILYQYALKQYDKDEIKCLYWNHYQESADIEIESLPNFVEVRNVDWINKVNGYFEKEGDPSGPIYIPGRNLVFAVLSACQELCEEIWLGAVLEEDHKGATDKNKKFLNESSKLLTYVLSPFCNNIKIRTPFVEERMTKRDIVGWALSEGCSFSDLEKTVSCYNSEEKDGKKIACGKCKQCLRRFAIFGSYGYEEKYKEHPFDSKENRDWMTGLIYELNKCDWNNPSLLNDLYWKFLLEYVEKYEKDDWVKWFYNEVKKNFKENELL